jgi:hypothetical protein
MNKGNLPGFTADDAVYASRTTYNAASLRAATHSDLLPQLRRWPKDDCIPGCICVSPINCPCCNSWWPWPGPGPTIPTEPTWPF